MLFVQGKTYHVTIALSKDRGYQVLSSLFTETVYLCSLVTIYRSAKLHSQSVKTGLGPAPEY